MDMEQCKDLHLHGGVVETLNCQGNVYMHGGLVQNLNAQGKTYQYGGIINHSIKKAQSTDNTIYRDRIVYKDRIVYRNDPSQALSIRNLERENQKLRRALLDKEKKAEDDDTLISRIRHLEIHIEKEREASKQKIEELEWRLKAVTDIANGRHEHIYEDESDGKPMAVTDDSLDVLFTLLNEYPFGIDKDMSEAYGISYSMIKTIAKALRLAKSPEARREAKDRLKRCGIEMTERRGGNHRNQFCKTNKK